MKCKLKSQWKLQVFSTCAAFDLGLISPVFVHLLEDFTEDISLIKYILLMRNHCGLGSGSGKDVSLLASSPIAVTQGN